MTRVVIEHKDGRRFSVTPEAHQELYPDFKVVGEETPDAFVAKGIPAPKTNRPRRRSKTGATKTATAPVSAIDKAVAEAEAEPDGGKVAADAG